MGSKGAVGVRLSIFLEFFGGYVKKIYVHKAYSFKSAQKFDRQFWRLAGSHARFSAAWQMVKDYVKMRGKSERLLRLRKSVQNIERLPS